MDNQELRKPEGLNPSKDHAVSVEAEEGQSSERPQNSRERILAGLERDEEKRKSLPTVEQHPP